MTREEATTKLKWFLESNLIEDISGCEGLKEAIGMAVEALANAPNVLNALDCISRQAAMEDISKQHTYKMFEGEDTLYLDANDVGSVLASLPSAQPDLEEDEDIPMEYFENGGI